MLSMDDAIDEGGRARWAWRAVFAWVALLFGVRIALDPLGINSDSAMYLECGRQLLEGKVPYRDFVDLNPPLIMYLSTIPNLVGRAFGISSITAFNVLVAGLVGWSGYRFHRFLRNRWLTLGALAASLVALYLRHPPPNVTGYRPFGQREHLMVLLFLPFFAVRMIRHEDPARIRRREAILVGIAAGLGLALKPHFLLLAAAPEVYWLLRRGGLRRLVDPEILAVAGVHVAYGLHFLLVPSAMRDEYFHRWTPLVWSGYDAFHATTGYLLSYAADFIAVVLVACAIAVFRRRADRRYLPMAAMALAGLLLYLGQRKGWVYHLVPAWTGASLIFALALSELAARKGLLRDLAHATLLGGLVVASVWLVGARSSAVESIDQQVTREIEAHSRAGDRVVLLSTAPWPVFPALVRSGRVPGTRYLWLFEIPMLYRLDPESRREADARIFSELLADLDQSRPQLIGVVRGSCFACPPGMSLLDYFRGHGLTFSEYQSLPGEGLLEWFTRKR